MFKLISVRGGLSQALDFRALPCAPAGLSDSSASLITFLKTACLTQAFSKSFYVHEDRDHVCLIHNGVLYAWQLVT